MTGVKVVRPEDPKKTIYGAGDEYAFLITGEESSGQYFVLEGLVPPGAGPPLHVQTREEEAFYVLEGEVVFHAGGKRVVGSAGTFLNVPRDVPHRFKNETDEPARLLIWFSPAGIEAMFEKMAGDPDNYVAIGADHGVQFLGPE